MAQLRIKMMDKNVVVKLRSNAVTKSTIKTVFMLADDALVTMAYEEGGIPILCEVDESGKTFLLPDEWPDRQFIVESDRVPSRPATPMDIQGITTIKDFWDGRVFRIAGNKLTGTCVLINERHALTAAHLSFKLYQSYKIKGAGNQEFSVTCIFICKRLDFAIPQSDDLPILEPTMGSLGRGDKYFMMGYPNGVDSSNPTITKGTIEGYMDDYLHLVGTPGSKRGYSGAPVFNESGRLAGLLLGGTSGLSVNTTIQECLDSSGDQKYARILGIGIIILRHSQGYSRTEPRSMATQEGFKEHRNDSWTVNWCN
ncbi:unnamed protein product [Caenorhabditis bovis]|uniref:Serine protease n=1 Tax=Caenorhabditis bovis TaxID=2654633 RepID=A0A8S1ERR0_9PELO|nr:unnamed protein product [Caenorhabditis bovis]